MSGTIHWAEEVSDDWESILDELTRAFEMSRAAAVAEEIEKATPDTLGPRDALLTAESERWGALSADLVAPLDEVRARLRDADGVAVQDVDGVRDTAKEGWWLLRASNAQPVLVGRCEAADAAGLERQIVAMALQLRQSGIEASQLRNP